VLGRHKGFFRYTVGQRKGIGIASEHALFVIELDPARNRVVLGSQADLFSSRLIARDVRYVSDRPVFYPFSIEASIRYAAQPVSAMVFEGEDGTVEVRFDEPVRAITPGQTVVFYKGEKVLGGGEIVRAL
jgi:tRNA-specific 2-thiouridylase